MLAVYIASTIVFDVAAMVIGMVVLAIGEDDDVVPIEFNSPSGQSIGMRLEIPWQVVKREAATTSSA